MHRIHIDFETRSNVDLKTATSHAYALDDSTDAWCMAYAVDDQPVKIWKLGEPFPADILKVAASGKNYCFVAHNAHFELTIWNYLCTRKYNWPKLPAKRTYCTMAMAYAMSLPGSLENAANATGMTERKDLEGRRLMLQMAAPRRVNEDGTFLWWDDDARKERLYNYCLNDVVVERELEKRLQPLSDREREVWLLDWEINQRGIRVDVPAVRKAIETINKEKERLDGIMHTVTNGMVKGTSDLANLTDFLNFNGIKLDGLAKADIRKALGRELPPAVAAALKARQEGAKSSTAKLKAMLNSVSPDGRIRGTMQYHGAGPGRWAGRKIQPQNFPRGELNLTEADIEDVIKNIDNPAYLSAIHGPPLTVISDALRGFIIPEEGHDLIAVDFASIEARVLAWLANQKHIVDLFRRYDASMIRDKDGHPILDRKGERQYTEDDIYCIAASDIFGRKITKKDKAERQVGKTAVLALGYQGGVAAFLVMARGYNVDMTPAYEPLVSRATSQELTACNSRYKSYIRKHCAAAKAIKKEEWEKLELRDVIAIADADQAMPTYQVIIASDLTKMFWRKANPQTVEWWGLLDDASKESVLENGKMQQVKTCVLDDIHHRDTRFIKSGSFLWLRLPNGRRLCYPYPKIKEMQPPWAEDEADTKPTLCYMGVDSKTHAWQQQKAYGGFFAENITQAVARDFLVEAIFRAEAAGYKVIFHVHDELVCEVPKDFGSVEELETLITAPVEWGFDCPIAAEGWRGRRYRK